MTSYNTTYLKNRHFGEFGGRYVPEMLIPALTQLEDTFTTALKDSAFTDELAKLYHTYTGRPTPLTFAENLTKRIGGAKIYLKREGLNHTGAHKINNCIGQALLTRYMGKKALIAETGAGQHGVATATVSAKFKFTCKVFMGEVDIKRQYPNVYSMKMLGTEVVPVSDGTKTLKDAVNAALKYWIENLSSTHYLLGSALGPYPFPIIVREFQSIIGKEVKKQIHKAEGKNPDLLIACVGGGSNSIGLFHPFLEDSDVSMIGVEAGGTGPEPGCNAARFQGKDPKTGIIQGYRSYFLQNEEGQVLPTHSISAGLDYAGVGPELAYLRQQGRISFVSALDNDVLHAL
jgi:tryptophan synthase beta chain